jgi:molecular chaperone GrpE
MSKKEQHNDVPKDSQDAVVDFAEQVDPPATSGGDGGVGGSSAGQPQGPQAAQGVGSDGQGRDQQDRINELTHDLQRLQAEFANYQRREAGAKADLLDIAKQQVVVQLLPLLDNIDRALTHRPEELKDNAWATGVEQVGRHALDQLKKLGVEKIQSVGQPFDHNLHEAISMEDGDGEQEMVIEELHPGYKIGERVIRHAMVKVKRQ